MRIDAYLYESGLAVSRTDAKRRIEAGLVFVDGKPVTKPAFDVSGLEDRISVLEKSAR